MLPTIGRIVHYQLSQYDADAINKRRADWQVNCRENGTPQTGHVAHVGNSAAEGQYFPAVVVASWGGTTVNLQVILDGTDTYWATSRHEGDEPGTWTWPPKAE